MTPGNEMKLELGNEMISDQKKGRIQDSPLQVTIISVGANLVFAQP
jgi:hypothetical protein